MMYELLAHVYDALVKDDEATACWVELIKAHIRGTELLELACGSGEITIALAQEGYHVDASDLSAAMIEEAKKKDGSEQVSWSVMDMCDLHTDKSYDGILCLCDSFNYLLKDEQVRALFQGAYRHLRDNGVFLGGYLCPYNLGHDGVLFRDESKKGWASVANLADGLTNTMDLLDDETDYGAKFFNPANDDVQNFVLQLLADLAKYDLDGIILDRCRYDDYGLESDFSDISKQKFEEYIGETVANFPADIMAPGTDEIPSDQPVYFKKWLEFRAKVIHDFIVKAREKVKSVNNNIKFGVYVGAWYSTYYTSGVNWASPKYNTSAYYPKWATSDYKNYGYADHLDYIFLGAYASVNNIYGSGEWTMEGFCKNGRELLQGDVPFAGGPDIGNSTGWTDGGQSAKIPDAIDACISNSDGFFAFDLCHVKKYDYWNAFKTGFDKYLESIEE